jgi:hypothetical protein
MCKVNGTYYLYSTGSGIPIRTSTDRKNWVVSNAIFQCERIVIMNDLNKGCRRDLPEWSAFGNGHLYRLFGHCR